MYCAPSPIEFASNSDSLHQQASGTQLDSLWVSKPTAVPFHPQFYKYHFFLISFCSEAAHKLRPKFITRMIDNIADTLKKSKPCKSTQVLSLEGSLSQIDSTICVESWGLIESNRLNYLQNSRVLLAWFFSIQLVSVISNWNSAYKTYI